MNDGVELLGLGFEVCVKGADAVWGSATVRGRKERRETGRRGREIGRRGRERRHCGKEAGRGRKRRWRTGGLEQGLQFPSIVFDRGRLG